MLKHNLEAPNCSKEKPQVLDSPRCDKNEMVCPDTPKYKLQKNA